MKAVDIVKPPSTNRLEEWSRWMNWMETQFRTMPYSRRIKIEVK